MKESITAELTQLDIDLALQTFNADPGACLMFRCLKRNFNTTKIVLGWSTARINGVAYDLDEQSENSIRNYVCNKHELLTPHTIHLTAIPNA